MQYLRHVRRYIVVAIVLCASTTAALSQSYPTRSIKVIVPFGAGGPADVYARIITQKLASSLGEPFVIDNRPGAGTVIGTNEAAKAAPDGYTLLVISNTQATNETLIRNKQYQLLRDFAPIALVYYADMVMVVPPSSPARNLQEFIALAKAKPGTLNYASSGIGSNYHMAGELLRSLTGIEITHVPYKGSGGARNDILGGQVDMMFDSISTAAPHIQSGQLRALATTGTRRSNALPNVPTMSEAGVPDYHATGWVGLVAPAKTPANIIERINREVVKVVSDPEVKSVWAARGDETMAMTPAEFTKFLSEEIEKWGQIAKAANVKID